MNKLTGSFSLGVFGMSNTQRMVLRSLCRLSQSRPVAYQIQDQSIPADIAIVDADDTEAMNQWRAISSRLPTVLVSSGPVTNLGASQYNVVRSQFSGSLLQILDRISVQELGHEGGVVVSDDLSATHIGDASRTSGSQLARALVIDDSVSVRTQMSLCLEQLDVAVDVAANATHGLKQLSSANYDIVFLDVMLPDMDGFQVCKQIKRSAETREVPVIMLTSKGSTINKIQGTIAGCDRYLTKPAAQSEVAKVVRDFVPNINDYALGAPV